ncbi:MAG: SulP family inorganic anion transporter [Pseudomonadota bacterium]
MAETGIEDRAKPAHRSSDVVRSVVAGIVTGSVCFAIMVALGAAVFSGPLQPALPQGLQLILFGGVVFALAGLVFGARTGTHYQIQSVTGVIAALAVSRIAVALPNASTDALFWSAVGFIVLSTATTGLVFIITGAARLGHVARFIPYPVLGGFLAATGLFLVGRAILISAPDAGGLLTGLQTLRLWGPAVALGMLLVLVERLTGLRYLLLWGIGVVTLIAHGGLYLLGDDTFGAIRFLAGEAATAPQISPFVWPRLSGANFEVVFAQVPLVFALAGLALVSVLVNAASIEIEGGTTLDLNKELMRAGSANILSSLGGGLVGYHSLSMTKLGRQVGGATGRIATLSAALLFVVASLIGTRFLSFVPVAALSLVLAYIGSGLLLRWLWDERGRLSTEDNAVIVIILGASALFGFVVALGIGVVAASMLFTVSYSRLQVIRNVASGKLRRSSTERSQADNALLAKDGAKTAVIELQGFIFFGTATKIIDRAEALLMSSERGLCYLLVDFRRVQAVDASAVSSMRKLDLLAQQSNVQLVFTGMRSSVFRMMGWTDDVPEIMTFRSLDKALSVIEDRLLDARQGAFGAETSNDFARLIDEIETVCKVPEFARKTLEKGDQLFARNATADSVVLLESGRLAAVVETNETGKARVASFLAGAIVGEIGYYGDIPRTADIVAEVQSTVRLIPRAAIEGLERTHPALAAKFHGMMARQMAARLARTTSLMYAIDS